MSSNTDKSKKSTLHQGLSLKGRALSYLAKREYSRIELKRKLSAYAESDIQLDTLLDELEANSWLSAQRFTESLLRRQAPRLGNARLLHELSKHQIDETLIDTVHTELQESEPIRAYTVWQKKFSRHPPLTELDPQQQTKERAKQIRFLLMRGFNIELATLIVDGRFQGLEE